MKKLLLALLLTTSAALYAQDSAPPVLSPELAPIAAKYKSEMDTLNAARDQALVVARKPYLAALVVSEQNLTASGKADALKAVLEEKQTVVAGRALPPAPSPAMPHDLASVRASYIHEIVRVGHDFAPRYQQLAGAYLRELSPLETKARDTHQTALLEQIAGEKLRVADQAATTTTADASHPTGRNLLVNGEFSQKNPDGTPTAWSAGSAKGTVETESGMNFLRFSGSQFEQTIDCPPGKRELTISTRIRCPDFKVEQHGHFGVSVYQIDGNGATPNEFTSAEIRTRERTWKKVGASDKIRVTTKKLRIIINFYKATGTADIADVRLEVQ